VTQTYNNCAESHLGGGVMSPFVSLLSATHDPEYSSQERLTMILWLLSCTDAYVPKLTFVAMLWAL